MADGVAEIENHAHTELPLIHTDHLGLHPYGGRDHLLQRRGIALVKGLAMALNEAEERRVPDEPSLDAFVNPSPQFPLGKGVEQCNVCHHFLWRIEAAHQILAGLQIDPSLAPHRGIYLRQQRGRYLDVIDSAHVDGAEKPAHVANHAAAECDQQGRAVCSGFGHLRGQPLHLGHALVSLAWG